jgi:DNA-binding response OmpR family regulator
MSMNGHSVLVVEDDPQLNELVGAYTQMCGFEYRPALDGQTALKEAAARTPDAVILDLMLPDVDGFEICRRLRKEPRTSRVPIIILSALAGEKEKQLGRECGADAYLTKPFNPDEFLTTLKERANGRAG